MATRADSPIKKCTEAGCDKALRARGLCTTHYNQTHQPNRHQKKAQPCAWCGTTVVKLPRSSARFGVVCSGTCRRNLQTVSLWEQGRSASTELVHQPRASSRETVDKRPRPTAPTRKRWFAGKCQACGDAFVSPHFEQTCSATCAKGKLRSRRQDGKYKRRALLRNAHVASVNRYAIYRRDNWTCWLCHEPVDRDADPQADRAPSLDHIIPLANGGTHEPANTATAHRLCNALRSNRPTLTSSTGEKVAVLF